MIYSIYLFIHHLSVIYYLYHSLYSFINLFLVTIDDMLEHNLNILEYVEVTVTITHRRRGDLRIELVCPNREHLSVLATPRHLDNDS